MRIRLCFVCKYVGSGRGQKLDELSVYIHAYAKESMNFLSCVDIFDEVVSGGRKLKILMVGKEGRIDYTINARNFFSSLVKN